MRQFNEVLKSHWVHVGTIAQAIALREKAYTLYVLYVISETFIIALAYSDIIVRIPYN